LADLQRTVYTEVVTLPPPPSWHHAPIYIKRSTVNVLALAVRVRNTGWCQFSKNSPPRGSVRVRIRVIGRLGLGSGPQQSLGDIFRRLFHGIGNSALTEDWCVFLSRVITALLTRDIDIAILSVRPSVRHVPVLYLNGLTYHHTFFSLW